MQINYKTMRSTSSNLITSLYDEQKTQFSIDDIVRITGLKRPSAISFASKLVRRELITHIGPGLFAIIPFDLGSSSKFQENPYIVARELMRGHPYFLSHASAMDLHQMVTQPQLVVYVTSPHFMRSRTISRVEYRFILCKTKTFFGLTESWTSKTDKVAVSDVERTILDCLSHPQHCGGISEIAKGLWIRHNAINWARLLQYAKRLHKKVIFNRLGFLLDLYGLADEKFRSLLKSHMSSSFCLLDPVMPKEGPYKSSWNLQINVPPEELDKIRFT